MDARAKATRAGGENASGPAARATRFPVHLPVRYRLNGEAQWRESTTANASRTGLLFSVESALEPHRELEVQVALDEGLGGSKAVRMRCRAAVVRAEPGGTAVAVRILEYEFPLRES